jgi:hypothetical protein
MTENKTAMVVSAHWADFGITPVWEKKYAAFKMADKRIFRTTPSGWPCNVGRKDLGIPAAAT